MERLNLPNPKDKPRPADLEPTSTPETDDSSDLETRLANLEAHVEWLTADVKKLRGRVTGGIRRTAEPENGNGNAPTVDEVNAMIRAGRFRR